MKIRKKVINTFFFFACYIYFFLPCFLNIPVVAFSMFSKGRAMVEDLWNCTVATGSLSFILRCNVLGWIHFLDASSDDNKWWLASEDFLTAYGHLFLFGIIPQSKTLPLFRRFSPEVTFKRSFSSISSLIVPEPSPLVKGFHRFLMLTGFLPSMNTLRLGKGWMKAEGLSTFTGFTGFLLPVSLPMWNQGGAISKGSLIFLYSKGFSLAWILLGQTNKSE